MSYEITNWVDNVTPLNAKNLKKMEQGIADAHSQLNDIATYPKELGAVLDNTADDTIAIQNAINTGKKLSGYGKAKITSISDIYGADTNDDLKLVLNGVLYNSYADKYNRIVFGQEYLSYFHRKIVAGLLAKIVFSGDSTTAGSSITDVNYKIDTLISLLAKQDGFQNITTVNRGQPSMSSLDWQNNYLAGDQTANPDLLILRWGINDPNFGRTVSDFLNSMRLGLANIRSNRTVNQLSIILMMPNSTSDTAHGRDELWYESINRGLKKLARKYQCCFIDTYAYLQDSRNANDYMDDPYGIGTHIHPKEVMNLWIADLMYNIMFPRTFRLLYGKGIVNPITTFQNAWANIGGAFQTANYWRDNNWIVHLNGVITGTTITKGTILFTLPYAPALTTFVTCAASNGIATLSIYNDGSVKIDTFSGTWLSLEGITFRPTISYTALP